MKTFFFNPSIWSNRNHFQIAKKNITGLKAFLLRLKQVGFNKIKQMRSWRVTIQTNLTQTCFNKKWKWWKNRSKLLRPSHQIPINMRMLFLMSQSQNHRKMTLSWSCQASNSRRSLKHHNSQECQVLIDYNIQCSKI